MAVCQICKPLYGTGLIFKEVTVEWPQYSEKEIYRVYPSDIHCDVQRKYVGAHTFNLTENYMVIDLVWDRFSPVEKFYRLKKRLMSKA